MNKLLSQITDDDYWKLAMHAAVLVHTKPCGWHADKAPASSPAGSVADVDPALTMQCNTNAADYHSFIMPVIASRQAKYPPQSQAMGC